MLFSWGRMLRVRLLGRSEDGDGWCSEPVSEIDVSKLRHERRTSPVACITPGNVKAECIPT